MQAHAGWRLRQRTPSPESDLLNKGASSTKAASKPRPRPDASRPRVPPSSESVLARVPSRTQLRHATAARRLAENGQAHDILGSNAGDEEASVISDPCDLGNTSYVRGTAVSSPKASRSSQAGPSSSSSYTSKDFNRSRQRASSPSPSPGPPSRPPLKRGGGGLGGPLTASEILVAWATGSLSSATKPNASDQAYYRALAKKTEARESTTASEEPTTPLMTKTLQAVGIDYMIDSANLHSQCLKLYW